MTGPVRPGRVVAVLGDQLTPGVAALRTARRESDVVLLAEVRDEANYVRHHKKKIALVFSAMRHFASELREDGWTVDYVTLTTAGNTGSIAGEIARAAERHRCSGATVTHPGEWRLALELENLRERGPVTLDILEDDRFICSRAEFAQWAEGRKQLRMEHFYRMMRRKTGLLMDGDSPAGGRWNFDSENRKTPPRGSSFPGPLRVPPDAETRAVLALVDDRFEDHFGNAQPFWFAVTRAQAERALDHFVENALDGFGHYQDAMLAGERFLCHSVLSLYLNNGLLDPLAVCRRVEAEWRAGRVPLNAAEGFIRQVIGWREFVRGIYWREMPDYADANALCHDRPLPAFCWTGDTDMACLRACIEQTREDAYAHHIQRLMVTGNFAMLAGVDPRAVHEWYLAVYADAYEWVELPNTLGMSQYADGGLLASKPYAASGNYIKRMSNYCADCRYKVAEKTGPAACPFNYLYWDFLDRQRERLGKNPRLAQPYRIWDRMDDERRHMVREDARRFLDGLE